MCGIVGIVGTGPVNQRLYDALKAARVDATLLVAYKHSHGFLNAGQPLWYGAALTEFLTRLLKP